MFKIQILVSIAVVMLFTSPYVIQIANPIDGVNTADFTYLLLKGFSVNLTGEFLQDRISRDIESIANDYPNETFVVGNQPDDYQVLADIYWGDKVEEFASIQDYNLWIDNKTVLYEKTFMPVPNIRDRRQIWIKGGMSVNSMDKTDYSKIKYAIGIGKEAELADFLLVKKYDLLYLSEKKE